MNPELESRLITQRRNATLASIVIGLLIMSLLALILWAINITIFVKETQPMIAFNTNEIVEKTIKKVKVTPQVQKTPTASTSSSVVKVITVSATASSFSVPTPDVAVENMSLEFGTNEGFGQGWSVGSGFGQGASEGNYTLFGRQGGSGGLKGEFYDCKMDKKRKVNKFGLIYSNLASGMHVRVSGHKQILANLIKKDFSESSLSDYFKAETELAFTHLIMGKERANSAPKAFNVENQVSPSGWLVKYEGTVLTTAPGEYRFIGIFDDILIVYVNDKIVFDGSWGAFTKEYSKGSNFGGKSLMNKSMRQGPYFKMSGKDKIRIIVGETPGGFVGGGLLIQQKDKAYTTDPQGNPILPPFVTEELSSADKERIRNIGVPLELTEIPVFKVLQ